MKYIITTLGCKVNQYETQAMEAMLRADGHEPASPGEIADAVIVNTCAVTAQVLTITASASSPGAAQTWPRSCKIVSIAWVSYWLTLQPRVVIM